MNRYLNGIEKRVTTIKRGYGADKKAVVGAVERGCQVRSKSVKKVNKNTLLSKINKFINLKQSMLITDDNMGYRQTHTLLHHEVIPHKACFAIGDIHTNNIKNFWSIVKRGIVGIYQHVSEKHLGGYMLEFAYKYNNERRL